MYLNNNKKIYILLQATRWKEKQSPHNTIRGKHLAPNFTQRHVTKKPIYFYALVYGMRPVIWWERKKKKKNSLGWRYTGHGVGDVEPPTPLHMLLERSRCTRRLVKYARKDNGNLEDYHFLKFNEPYNLMECFGPQNNDGRKRSGGNGFDPVRLLD